MGNLSSSISALNKNLSKTCLQYYVVMANFATTWPIHKIDYFDFDINKEAFKFLVVSNRINAFSCPSLQ